RRRSGRRVVCRSIEPPPRGDPAPELPAGILRRGLGLVGNLRLTQLPEVPIEVVAGCLEKRLQLLRLAGHLGVELHPGGEHAGVLQAAECEVIFGVDVGSPDLDRLALVGEILELPVLHSLLDLALDPLIPVFDLDPTKIVLMANGRHICFLVMRLRLTGALPASDAAKNPRRFGRLHSSQAYQARSRAWPRSASRSSMFSMPTENRITSPSTPSGVPETEAWVIVSGCSISDSTPPRLSASMMSFVDSTIFIAA